MKNFFQKYGWLVLAFFAFFFLLGNRSLNEPDEGRYSEIAREMIETGNWLVPHLWYMPHLDKPPMTYWLEAISMKFFGQNEWAVRLPLALAGIGGVWATFLLGCSMGGRRAGIWSALILQSSLLYFVMSRMLTTDIYLTLFNVWAIYFFWRSWLEEKAESENWKAGKFFAWHLAGWAAMALGFLTKGPIALAIPAVSFFGLWFFRRKQVSKKTLFIGATCGVVLFLILILPWFLTVFHEVPHTADFMIFGQAAGHLFGTTIKNRAGSPFYFFAILFVGLMPWTIWLGWLWRRAHWRGLDQKSKDGWAILNIWVVFTFTLFSLSRAKLPAYILPIFPPLAILLALRFFNGENLSANTLAIPRRICALCAFLLPLILPLSLKFAFHVELSELLFWQTAAAIGILLLIFWRSSKWTMNHAATFTVGLTLLGYFLALAEIPQFENSFRGNQTLKPLGIELKKNYQPGDAIVCWGKLPQGLPFYADGVISMTNRPYFGGMNLAEMPFRFPGNRERLGDLLLSDDNALMQLLRTKKNVWLVGFGGTIEKFQQNHSDVPLHLVDQVGQWQLYLNH